MVEGIVLVETAEYHLLQGKGIVGMVGQPVVLKNQEERNTSTGLLDPCLMHVHA